VLAALPVVIVGGYLGAGKTTLMNHVLRNAGGRRIAVLVNDFGEVNIDADLIEGATSGLISLSGGCLCCSFGDDLPGTLQSLALGNDKVDVVLIELSGVALPAPVARSIKLARGVEVAGTLVLADASSIQRQCDDTYVGETVRQQLCDADWILLNKSDLVTAVTASALPSWLAEVAPNARVIPCGAREMDPDLVLGWRAQALDSHRSIVALQGRPIGGAQRRAQGIFASRSFMLPSNVDLAALGCALAVSDTGVLRAKALVQGSGGRGRCLQVSAGRWQIDDAALPGEARLVVIGLKQSLVSDPLFFSRLDL
jgi:G3E family GTPase